MLTRLIKIFGCPRGPPPNHRSNVNPAFSSRSRSLPPLRTSITSRPSPIHQPNRILRNGRNTRKRRRLKPQIPLLKPRPAHRMRLRVLPAGPGARVVRCLPELLGRVLVRFLVGDGGGGFGCAGGTEDLFRGRVGDGSGEEARVGGAARGADTLEEGGHGAVASLVYDAIDVGTSTRMKRMTSDHVQSRQAQYSFLRFLLSLRAMFAPSYNQGVFPRRPRCRLQIRNASACRDLTSTSLRLHGTVVVTFCSSPRPKH